MIINRILKYLLVSVAFFGLSKASFAQSEQEFRQTLHSYFQRIDKDQDNRGAILEIDDTLLTYLRRTLPKISESLYADYSSLSPRLTIATSPDGSVRFWSWADGASGSIQMAMAVAEWQTPAGIVTGYRDSHNGLDTIGRCDSIMIAHCLDETGKPIVYYIGIFAFPANNGFYKRGVQIFRIEGEEFKRQPNVFEDFSAPRDLQETSSIELYYRTPTSALQKKIERITLSVGESYGSPQTYYNILLVPSINNNYEICNTSQEYREQEGTFYKGGVRYYPKEGESLADLNRTLGSKHRKLDRFVDSSGKLGHYDDSLSNVSAWLSDYLKATLPRIPQTMKSDIDSSWDYVASFKDGRVKKYPFLWLASSSDGNMRIWTWNTWTGGSMPNFDNLVEYRTDSGIKVIDLERDLGWGAQDRGSDAIFDTIYLLSKTNGTSLYFPKGIWRGDGRNSGSELEAFAINRNQLQTDMNLFPPDTAYQKGFQPELSIGCEDCKVPEIKMNGSKLYVQHIDSSGGRDALTSRFDEYDFDGEHFVYKGQTK